MSISRRIELLMHLKSLMLSDDPSWLQACAEAERKNPWFIAPFIRHAVSAITSQYLDHASLTSFSASFSGTSPRVIGWIPAGNIPMVGFHDFLCLFLSGHTVHVKWSGKDDVLIPFLLQILCELEPALKDQFITMPLLKNCDAYLATGSDNSTGLFAYYFSKYPHLFHGSRTSVAILRGDEQQEELDGLADDVFLYFGLGCRNVTQILLPEGYDQNNLWKAFGRYRFIQDHHKYKNNFDYQTAVLLLNRQPFLADQHLILLESPALFSPISVLHYSFYQSYETTRKQYLHHPEIQTIVSRDDTPFGQSQMPALTDFADGTDTRVFLNSLEV